MTRAEERNIYARALATHGITTQTLMLAEECSELVKAASKCCRYFSNLQPGDPVPPHLIENLIEEIADVDIMVEQMKMEYYITDSQVEDMKEAKLCRLKQRLGLK